MPEGALSIAQNIDIVSAELAQPRRGFELAAATGYTDGADRTDHLFFYQDKMFAHHGTYLSADALSYYNSGWQSVGAYSAPTSRRMQSITANQNLYFTTNAGVKKLDAYNATVSAAGVPKALNAATALITGTWFEGETDDQIVAYRNAWAKYDTNDNLVIGAPSGRVNATNNLGAGNDRAVGVTIYIPSGVNTTFFCQLYRSTVVASPTATPVEPSDELYLAYEAYPTAGSFSSYSKTFLDAGVNTGTEVITSTAHGFTDGDMVYLTTTGTLPTGLSTGTLYYVISATTDTFKLSTSYGGAAVNITAAAGGGTHTIKGAQAFYIEDIVPDALLGAALYTNATQEGLAYQNEQPPLARDICVFNDCTFYAYTTSKHRYYLTLLTASGMANDDTITIASVTYTAKAAETASSGQFKLFTAGSAAQNIADTAKSLVNVINNYVSNTTVYAYYLSSGDDLPGKILIEERGIGSSQFFISASDPSDWSPTGIPTSGSTEGSTNDDFKNGLSWSKPKQPEHVPLVNQVRVGNEDDEILAIVPLKDALIIFKEDGIYRLTGFYPNFSVELLDSSAKLIGSHTPSILNNEIYCLTDLGICRVSDSVEIISVKISQELIQNISTNASLIASIGFGQGYETDKKYYLFLPEDSGDTYPTFAYVYNIFTNTLVKHYLNATCSTVYGKNIYLGSGNSEYILKERKNYSYLDYADYNVTSAISSISSLTVTISSGTDQVTVGDIIWQSNSLFATVTAINTITSEITIDQDPGFTVAACTLLKAIDTKLKWTVFADPTPGVTKQYSSINLFFQESFNGTGYVGFSTDLDTSETLVELTGNDNAAWGLFPWGEVPWGGVNSPRSWGQWVPRSKQRCSQMNVSFSHRWGYSSWKMAGGMLNGEQGSEKIRRN